MLTWWIFLNKVVFNHIWLVVAGRYRRLTHCTEDSGWAVHVQIQALYELKWFHVLLLPLLITDWTDQMSLIRSNIFLTMFPNSIFHLKAEQMSLFFFLNLFDQYSTPCIIKRSKSLLEHVFLWFLFPLRRDNQGILSPAAAEAQPRRETTSCTVEACSPGLLSAGFIYALQGEGWWSITSGCVSFLHFMSEKKKISPKGFCLNRVQFRCNFAL